MFTNKEIIEELNFLVRTYAAVTKTIVATKNRYQSINKEGESKFDFIVLEMESQKGKIARRIKRYLDFWPIWTQWLSNVPGIGPHIGANLILLYYYRFTPVCPDCNTAVIKKDGTFWCEACEKSIKGEGNLTYGLTIRDFSNVSKWWHYMGVHVKDGKKPRRMKGVQQTWSTKGRTLAYMVGESFVKQNETPYKQFYNERKMKRKETHPEASKMHHHNMAKNETAKLFLAHFWQVAREIEGLPDNRIYAQVIMGHTGVIEPFYWEGHVSNEIHRTNASHATSETQRLSASQGEDETL